MRISRHAAGLLLAMPLLFSAVGLAEAAQFTVVINQMKFGPVPATLRVGDVIVWQNDDILRHTVTARDRSFDIDLAPKSEASLTLASAGTFPFFCKFHPSMTGQLVVSP